MNWVFIFIGGGLGSVGRYALSYLMRESHSLFPWPTLLSNIVAAMIISILFFSNLRNSGDNLWCFAAIGFCGGLSTFSTFSLETFQLFRDGQPMYAWLNVGLSVTCCLLTVFLFSRIFQPPA